CSASTECGGTRSLSVAESVLSTLETAPATASPIAGSRTSFSDDFGTTWKAYRVPGNFQRTSLWGSCANTGQNLWISGEQKRPGQPRGRTGPPVTWKSLLFADHDDL